MLVAKALSAPGANAVLNAVSGGPPPDSGPLAPQLGCADGQYDQCRDKEQPCM